MRKRLPDMPRPMRTYLAAIICSALALGLSDGVFANYFRDAYQVTALERGIIEGPRELPGVLCVFITAAFAFLGETKMATIAQALMFLGIIVLALCTPPFGVMLIFLFINSLGMHVAMPLQDSIGMSLAEPEKLGRRMGLYNAVKTGATMLTGALVFVGFRAGFFSFTTPVKVTFLLAAALFVGSFALYARLHRQTGAKAGERRHVRLVFRHRYRYFYALAVTRGVQKQVMYVFAPWILIELMGQRADTTAILSMCSALIGIFLLPQVGRWIDRLGVPRLLILESLLFLAVYGCYGLTSGALHAGRLAATGLMVAVVCGLYILDRCVSSLGMVRTVYLRSIVPDPSEVTPALSTALSLDHVVSIAWAYVGGIIWSAWGPQYVFYIGMLFAAANLVVSLYVRRETAEAACSRSSRRTRRRCG